MNDKTGPWIELEEGGALNAQHIITATLHRTQDECSLYHRDALRMPTGARWEVRVQVAGYDRATSARVFPSARWPEFAAVMGLNSDATERVMERVRREEAEKRAFDEAVRQKFMDERNARRQSVA